MKLSIVIINYKTPQLTINCLHSLAMDRSEFSDYDVWLIDNASGDNSPSQIVAAIRENNWGKWVHFRQSNKNIGFAAGNNFLIREILRRKNPAEKILLLNSDTLVQKGCLEECIIQMELNKRIGILSCELLNTDGSLQKTSRRMLSPGREMLRATGLPYHLPGLFAWGSIDYPESRHKTNCNVDWVCGAFMMIRTELLRRHGLLDEDFFFYGEDLEFCHRIRKQGYCVRLVSHVSTIHLGGASSDASRMHDRCRAKLRWQGLLKVQTKCYGDWARQLVRLSYLLAFRLRKIKSLLQSKEETISHMEICQTISILDELAVCTNERRKLLESPPRIDPGRIAAVVIGRNEGERLKRCLHSLKTVERIVYVDSGSTDGSVEFARSLGITVLELDISKPFSMARARNAGFIKLMQIDPAIEYVQFIDGDCEMHEDWISKGVHFLDTHPEIVAVCGRLREKFKDHSIYNKMMDVEWQKDTGLIDSTGGIATFRTEAFRNASGFNEEIIAGEEPELCLRLRRNGYLIYRLPVDMACHDANIEHFSQWWRRSIRNGYGATDVLTRCKKLCSLGKLPFYTMLKSTRRWTLGWLFFTVISVSLSALCPYDGAVAIIFGFCLGLYSLQALRISKGVRSKCEDGKTAVAYGVLAMLSKWAQLIGQIKYKMDKRSGKAAVIIEYKEGPSSWQSDLARYPYHAFVREQSLWALAVYRFGSWNDKRSKGISHWLCDRVYWALFRIVETLTGVSFTKSVAIGPGMRIYHFGNIFIHSNVKIGANCTMRQGVTIGNRSEDGPVPVIGDDVEIGAYAQVLGGIKIGIGAKIGAMSVVLQDVPAGRTVVGIPAKLVPLVELEKTVEFSFVEHSNLDKDHAHIPPLRIDSSSHEFILEDQI